MLLLAGSLLRRGRGRARAASGVLLLLRIVHDALVLLGVLALGVPLTRLQDEDAEQDEGKDGLASGHDLQAVLASEHQASVGGLGVLGRGGQVAGEVRGVPDAGAHEAQALDDVGDVDADADDVEHERRAVEQHVALGRLKQLGEEAQKAGDDHDAQHARDQGRRLVYELQVRLELVEIGRRDGIGGPEEREVIREFGEEDAEEKADSWIDRCAISKRNSIRGSSSIKRGRIRGVAMRGEWEVLVEARLLDAGHHKVPWR